MQPELNHQCIKTECERCFQILIQISFCIQCYILHCGVFTVCVERRKPHHWAASPAGTCQARSLLFFACGTFGRMCLCGLIKWLWSRSWSQCELKLPEDLCKLHSARGCYKLAPYSSCDVNRMEGAKKCRALAVCPTEAQAVHYLGTFAHGTGREEWWTCTIIDKSTMVQRQ